MFKMPAQYMFKDIPNTGKKDDYIAYTVELMDKFNIERAMTGLDDMNEITKEALRRFPNRFFASYEANPNNGMDEVRKIKRLHKEFGIKAVTAFPSGLCPQVPIGDKKWYPIFTTCVELDIPICPCVGVPGPRLPMAPQNPEQLDEICWFFPELKVVMRHGAEPWTALVLHDQCICAQALFAGHHQLRQYPRCRQDHVRGIFSNGLVARSHFRRHAERAVQGQRMAKIPA